MEKIFETSLKRLEAVDNLICSKEFDKKDYSYRYRVTDLYDRLQLIVAGIFYKRNIESKIVEEIRNGYVDFDKDMTFLSFDKYGFCEELWKDYWILVNEDFFESLFKATKQREINNIENKNLKLF